jgi:hypothetical protein
MIHLMIIKKKNDIKVMIHQVMINKINYHHHHHHLSVQLNKNVVKNNLYQNLNENHLHLLLHLQHNKQRK